MANNRKLSFQTSIVFAALAVLGFSVETIAQTNIFINGDFENVNGENLPEGWRCMQPEGLVFKADDGEAQKGERSLLIDTTDVDFQGPNFVATSQVIDATPYRGKTLQFRAAVKTADLSDNAAGQLWMRIDRESGEQGGFDNMGDRPITDDDWTFHEIVLDVDEDASQILAGLIVSGHGKVWLDSASLTVASKDDSQTGGFFRGGKDTPTKGDDKTPDSTASNSQESEEKKPSNPQKAEPEEKKKKVQPPQRNAALMKAFQEAGNAPTQPFFNHWLWIPLIAFILFGLSALPDQEMELLLQGESQKRMVSGHIAKFAFRFSCAFWILYNLPALVSEIVPHYGQQFQMWCARKWTLMAEWAAVTVFKMEGELVPATGNGSGDTTEAYITALLCFTLAIILAALWTAVDWRKTNYANLKDLLRSYLRYSLAFWMLSYGLAKVAWDSNQFGMINEWQLNKTWGSSSPMNVVWSFMGASRAYTVFAGMGEVIGGLLLIWRRTTVLGAMVVIGVMTNVAMLNYCYDVPVKLFSTHLLAMAFYILLPDLRRLANVLFFNRTAEPVDFRPPYTNWITIWIQRTAKAAIIIMAVAIPLYQHGNRQIDYFQQQSELPEYFGHYEVDEYKLAGKVKRNTASNMSWKSVRFGMEPDFSGGVFSLKPTMVIGMHKAVGRMSVTFEYDEDPYVLKVLSQQGAKLPKEEIKVDVLDAEHIKLTGMTSSGLLEVTLKRNGNVYPVRGRGYRWINEVPYNR